MTELARLRLPEGPTSTFAFPLKADISICTPASLPISSAYHSRADVSGGGGKESLNEPLWISCSEPSADVTGLRDPSYTGADDE